MGDQQDIKQPEYHTAEEHQSSIRYTSGTQRPWLSAANFSWTILIISILLMSISITVTAWTASSSRAQTIRNEQIAIDNKNALCGLKTYAQSQVESTSDFLAENPGAEPIPGVSRTQLIQQLERQRAFRDTLINVDCEGNDP